VSVVPPAEASSPAAAKWFATTHWSVVLSAADSTAPGAGEALEKLCRTYWYPLYAYVRREGRSVEDAQDLTQEFFARVLENKSLRKARRERGRFRSFLLTSFQNFLAHEWERARAEKRGGGRPFISWEETSAENRYQLEAISDLTPDKIFEQRWALALFQEAIVRLRQEFVAAGKTEQFTQLKAFLSGEAGEGDYGAVAARLSMTPNAVAVAVHRLRQRYGQLVREEVAHTVSSPAEVDEELRHLIALMSA
jgi:RNA polymerase sigma-70 factor (ECF subfamily)